MGIREIDHSHLDTAKFEGRTYFEFMSPPRLIVKNEKNVGFEKSRRICSSRVDRFGKIDMKKNNQPASMVLTFVAVVMR